MSVQVDQISSFQKRLQFDVPGTVVARKLDEAYRTLSNRVNIPGFRRGHIPRRLLEQRYGRQILGDVAADIINTEFRLAAVDMEYIGQPDVRKDELRAGANFSFSITVQVRPEITVKDYVGMRVDFPVPQVDDDRVEALVGQRLAGASRLVEVDDGRAVEPGDLVLTEIARIDGDEAKIIESGTMVNTAGDRYYPGIEPLLVGVAKGASATGTVTIDETSQTPALRNQTVELKVTVHAIQVSRAPELTDEVAGELGFEGGVVAMRAALRMEEEGRATEASRNVARVNLLQKLTAAHDVDVPPAMIDSHLQLLLEELRIQAAYRGRDPRSIRYTDPQMEDLRHRAAFAAKASLLLEAISKKEGVEVTDADLETKYQEIADTRGQRVEAIRGYFKKDNAVEELRKRLLEERALEWLLERAELVEVSPNDDAPAKPASIEGQPAAAAKPAKKKAKAAEAAPAEPEAAPAVEEKPKKKATAKKKAAE